MTERVTRTDFLQRLSTAGVAACGFGAGTWLARKPAFAEAVPADPRLSGALVLGGGGARGAYEAGWIEGLRAAHGVSDGQPLPGIDMVCGTSIGSLNAHFVATAQYRRLAELWHTVGRENVLQLKRRYAATANPHAFILTKILQALSLATGLTKNVEGILDGDVVEHWIAKHVDPAAPLVLPYIFATTNLDRGRTELFAREPRPDPTVAPTAVARLRDVVGVAVPVRIAHDDLLARALRASTSIPVLLDPVILESPEGTQDHYIDGGITDNDPIDVGRALAHRVYLILVDPATLPRTTYANALEIAVGSFGVAQRRIFEASLRAATLATKGKRLFDKIGLTPEQRQYIDALSDVDLFIARPDDELPLQFVEFDRQEKIDAAYERGQSDAAKGWTPYG